MLPVEYVSKNELCVSVLALVDTETGEKNETVKWDDSLDEIECVIDVSIDGGESWVESKVDFKYYKEMEWVGEEAPAGVLSGGTAVEFVGSNEGEGPSTVSDESVVKFFTEDGMFEEIVRAEGRQEEGGIRLVCSAPAFVQRQVNIFEGGEGGREEGEGGEENKSQEEEEAKLQEGEEDVGDEGSLVGSLDEGSVNSVLPLLEGVDVLCSVAYNGVNFGKPCGKFSYYLDPVVTVCSEEIVSEGKVIRITGSNFFTSDEIKVRFSGEGGVCEEVVGNLVRTGIVECTVPKLVEEEEEEEKKEGGEDSGGEESESGERGEEEESSGVRFFVSVSFNKGLDFSAIVEEDAGAASGEEEEDTEDAAGLRPVCVLYKKGGRVGEGEEEGGE